MKLFKEPGRGLTHCRGTTDLDISKWILSMPVFMDIFESCQKFCKASLFGVGDQQNSDSHDDGSRPRIAKDNKDLLKIIEWLTEHSPFGSADTLMSISTGVIANTKINCHEAFDLGTQGVKKIINKKIR